MKYFELDFKITPFSTDAADLLMTLVGEAGLESFVETEDGFKGYAQERLFHQEALDEMVEAFPFIDHQVTYTIVEAEDKNWNEQWEKEGFKPVVIADRVLVTNQQDEVSSYDYKIIIDPHQAFGTGGHQTTGMIIERLLHMDMAGLDVLDAGCGTGILSIFALMRGAKHVFAYDIDNWSVRNTLENVALNSVAPIDVVEGDASVLTEGLSYDVVLANINRNILLADMPAFRSVMHNGSRLVLSGFYVEDIPVIREKAESLGMNFVHHREKNNWAAVKFVMKV
ncbi:MAG: 50S ribosomal protein L11 methyltransferase [Paraprevotella sp.]|nr:50S ribosomal protein L11 methyltransferase [Paraprevotella sp.]